MEPKLTVIGGGPAGLSAALAAWEEGVRHIVIIEREKRLGGILLQCIHNGFGLQYFEEDLTGPEYATRLIGELSGKSVTVLLDTSVISLSPERTIVACSSKDGLVRIDSTAIILAMGCRERTRGALCIPGSRPSGVFTAGLAQRYMNIDGFLPGRRVVVLGSGDIGMIMARRLTLEGACVAGVYEVQPFPGGLTRNIVQCLEDYDIPLYLGQTVTKIHGQKRVSGVSVAEVDSSGTPLYSRERFVSCDTLLLSAGLIPENELTREAGIEIDRTTGGPVVTEDCETSVPGIFACGNVLHVHDLVDHVSVESETAGRAAARFISEGGFQPRNIPLTHDSVFRYVVPHRVSGKKDVDVYFRVRQPLRNVRLSFSGTEILRKPYVWPGEMGMTRLRVSRVLANSTLPEIQLMLESGNTLSAGRFYRSPSCRKNGKTHTAEEDSGKITCILCPLGCAIRVSAGHAGKMRTKGARCKKGEEYAIDEYRHPLRVLTSTVKVIGGESALCPVRTARPVSRDAIPHCMQDITRARVHAPVSAGQAILKELAGEPCSLLATRSIHRRRTGTGSSQ
jgi:NADPH-dependent 2,4-dienoyl-CoA reductase/sulfur reductase-like enzyme/CxxC motif-containing protein